MSYEGYEEYICEDGHYYAHWASYDGPEVCHCGKPSVWNNPVDETNCDGFPFTIERLRVKDETELDTCDSCGHTKQTKEATYFVPTKEEMDKFCEDRNKHFNDLYENLGD